MAEDKQGPPISGLSPWVWAAGIGGTVAIGALAAILLLNPPAEDHEARRRYYANRRRFRTA